MEGGIEERGRFSFIQVHWTAVEQFISLERTGTMIQWGLFKYLLRN